MTAPLYDVDCSVQAESLKSWQRLGIMCANIADEYFPGRTTRAMITFQELGRPKGKSLSNSPRRKGRAASPDTPINLRVFAAVTLIALLSFLSIRPTIAQTQAPGPTPAPSVNGPYDVFVNSSISKGKPGLFFVDARTGLSNIVVTNGQYHTLLHSGVLYQEIGTNAIKVAYPDGRIEPFAPIQLPDPKASLVWIASEDGSRVVWAISQQNAQQQTTLSDMYLAGADGSNPKLILHSSSTKGILTVPLAVTTDGATVFYARSAPDKRPYGLFPVATDVFSLDVASGQTTDLPGKTECACAVGFSANGSILARLESAGAQDFAVHIYNLALKTDTQIAAPGLPNLQAGNILVSGDNRLVA